MLIEQPSLSSQFDRLPPSDIKAEMAVLGSLALCGNEPIFDEVAAMLPTTALFQADHQIIFDAMKEMRKANKPIDALLLRAELANRKLLDEIGGTAYLAQIVDAVPSAAHVKHYAELVLSKWKLREAIAVSNDILRACYTPHTTEDAGELLMQASSRLVQAAATGSGNTIVALSDAVNVLMENLHGGKCQFLLTGLSMLDDVILGLTIGGYTLIGADSRTGKSLVAKDICVRLASRGVPCGIVAMEETQGKIAANVIARESNVESKLIMGGKMTAEEWKAVYTTAPEVQKLPIYIDELSGTIDEIETTIALMVHRHKCQVIVIDHFHLIDVDSGNETAEQSKISGRLKRCFKRHNVCGIVLTQINKGEKDLTKKPTEKDIRGTNRQFNDCDVCVLLYREDYARMNQPGFVPNNLLELHVRKSKNSNGAVITYKIDTAHQRLEEVTEEF